MKVTWQIILISQNVLIFLCAKFCPMLSIWTTTFYYSQTIFFCIDISPSHCGAGSGIQVFPALLKFIYIWCYSASNKNSFCISQGCLLILKTQLSSLSQHLYTCLDRAEILSILHIAQVLRQNQALMVIVSCWIKSSIRTKTVRSETTLFMSFGAHITMHSIIP